ncbi:MAG: hypothetical protein LBC61_07880 [Candidatus Peribacteria bacterium]|nr:hypothetical protein [Candidatus Peribacteria bacterium]
MVASLNKIIVKYRNDEVKYEILKILTERIEELKFDNTTKNDENNVSKSEEENNLNK